MTKRIQAAVAVAATILLTFAGGANASTQIGSTCGADMAGSGPILNRGHVSPTSGVITSWGINISPGEPPPSSTQYLLVLANEGGNNWRIKGLSLPVVMAGSIVQGSRIPIAAGETIGAWGSGGWTFSCETAGGAGDFEFGNLAVTPTINRPFSTTSDSEETTALWARIEPDVDGDGFGDETQDGCPASIAFTGACPAPAVKPKVKVKKSELTLTFAAEAETKLNISGSVKLPSHAGKATLKKSATALGGKQTKVTLKFPSKLKSALKSLPRSKSLKLSLKIKGTALGKTANKKLTIKLKGLK